MSNVADKVLARLETCRSGSQRVAGSSNSLLQDIGKKGKRQRENSGVNNGAQTH